MLIKCQHIWNQNSLVELFYYDDFGDRCCNLGYKKVCSKCEIVKIEENITFSKKDKERINKYLIKQYPSMGQVSYVCQEDLKYEPTGEGYWDDNWGKHRWLAEGYATFKLNPEKFEPPKDLSDQIDGFSFPHQQAYIYFTIEELNKAVAHLKIKGYKKQDNNNKNIIDQMLAPALANLANPNYPDYPPYIIKNSLRK